MVVPLYPTKYRLLVKSIKETGYRATDSHSPTHRPLRVPTTGESNQCGKGIIRPDFE